MELKIEKLVYGGDGLARLPSDAQPGPGKAVFVPYTLPDERVAATIVEQKTGFARARLDRVLSPSPLRSSAPCPYFGSCGGCHYQHTSYEEQLRLKADILQEQLLRTAKLTLELPIETHASPPLHYRNRTRFHLRHEPAFAIGYFRHGSRDLLPVNECPISSPLINRALPRLWELGKAEAALGINEIELFADGNDERLLVELYLDNNNVRGEELKDFSVRLARAIPETDGIASFSPAFGVRSPVLRNHLLHGSSIMQYRTKRSAYGVSAGAFFQTNRHLIDRMVDVVVDERHGKLALDLYSGVGLFALPLAQNFERVIAVESSPISGADLRKNLPANASMSPHSVEEYLANFSQNKPAPDLVVADPPRAGLGTAVCRQISALATSEVVYVSCDPATLARDLKQLSNDAWRISAMHMVDLFPQTFHIETITVLQR